MSTAMFEAFLLLPAGVLKTPLGSRVYAAARRQAKRQYAPGRGWDANLTYKTWRELVAVGVMPG